MYKKILSLFFLLGFLIILGIGTTAVYAGDVATDGKNIYAFEGTCICKYDMNGNNREVIYEGLPYGISILEVYNGYLYFQEEQEQPDGLATKCDFKVLNLIDYSTKLINKGEGVIEVELLKEKLYFTHCQRGDYGPVNLYFCDADGSNVKIITEKYGGYLREIDGYLYYLEAHTDGYIQRVVKSNTDGSEPIVLLDWLPEYSWVIDINKNNAIYYTTNYDNGKDIYYQKTYSTGEEKEINNYENIRNNYDNFFYDNKNNEYYAFNDYENEKSYFYLLLPTGEKRQVGTFDSNLSFLNIVDGVLYYRNGGKYYTFDYNNFDWENYSEYNKTTNYEYSAKRWYQASPLDVKSIKLYEPEITTTPTTSTLLIDGEQINFSACNINGNNYFKLRDLAYILNGSSSQFDVGWDANQNLITIDTGFSYNMVGGEMSGNSADSQNALTSKANLIIDGQTVNLEAYNIGGNNYFMLRDLANQLGFDVDWDSDSSSIIINTVMELIPVDDVENEDSEENKDFEENEDSDEYVEGDYLGDINVSVGETIDLSDYIDFEAYTGDYYCSVEYDSEIEPETDFENNKFTHYEAGKYIYNINYEKDGVYYYDYMYVIVE